MKSQISCCVQKVQVFILWCAMQLTGLQCACVCACVRVCVLLCFAAWILQLNTVVILCLLCCGKKNWIWEKKLKKERSEIKMEKVCSYFPFKIDRNVQIAAGVLTGLAATGYIVGKVTASIRLDPKILISLIDSQTRLHWTLRDHANMFVITVIYRYNREHQCYSASIWDQEIGVKLFVITLIII